VINILHFGDITQIDGHKVPIVDVITGGSPCQDLSVAGLRKGLEGERSGLFMEQMRIVKEMRAESKAKGKQISPRYMVWENVCHCGTTLITTSTGYKYIKDVEIGELVRTHDGTYHKVLQTYKTEMQHTIKVKFQGGMIECTPNHPFLTEDLSYKPIGEFKIGDRVGFKIDEPGTKSIGMPIAYAFGRWLADGSIAIRNDRKTKHRIFISTGYKKYDELKSELSKLPYKVNEHKMDWAINFTFSSDEFGELTDSAGYGARHKQVPEWVFELVAEEQAEVLRGYLAGDGYFREDRGTWSFGTSSEKLALGLCRLIRAVYHVGVSLSYKEGKGTTIIEGREVNAHDHWVGEFSLPIIDTSKCKNIPNRAKYENGYVWVRIREISEGEVQDVYNLSVADNNTYEANGVVCHNCGAFSSGSPAGADFQAVLEEIVRVVTDKAPSVPIPEDGWSYAGNIEGVGDDGTPFSICWRTVDAQYWGRTVIDNCGRVVKRGTPQRRRRISLVADFGGLTAPEILFERSSVSGDPESSRKEGQETPGTTGTSIEKSGTNGITAICIGNGQVDNAVTPEVELSKTLNCMQDPMKIMISPTSEGTVRTYKKDAHAKTSEDGQGWVETEVNDTLNAFDNGETRTPTLVFDMLNLNPKGDDKCQTLNAYNGTGGNNMPLVYENHSQDTRYKELGDICTTVSATFGMGGNNTPFVVENSQVSTDEPTVYEWYRRDTRATELGDVCSTVQASYGSGGNNMPYVVQKEPILLESNQNHATVQTDGVSTALPASMGEGGGYVPMVVEESTYPVKQEGCDVYNHEVTGEVAVTVTPDCGGTNTIGPKVLMYNDVITCTKQLATTSDNVSSALEATDYKQAQAVCYGFEPGVAQRIDPENRFTEEVAPTLRANAGDNQAAVVYGIDQQGGKGTAAYSENVAPTMASDSHGTPHAVVYGISALDSNAMKSANPNSGIYQADTSRTLDLNGGNPACNQGGMMILDGTVSSTDKPLQESVKSYGVTTKGNGDAFIADERHTALSTGGGEPGQGYPCVLTVPTDNPDKCLNPWDVQSKHIQSENGVAESLYSGECRYGGGESYVMQNTESKSVAIDMGGGKSSCSVLEETAPTLATTHYGEPAVLPSNPKSHSNPAKMLRPVVRRLTPVECERLMGFPDNWTMLGDWVDSTGKKHKDSDSARYKALGNSICLPYWFWLAGRMCDQLRKSGIENPTMASLFDGISGFPLVYVQHGCTPVWSSEIEEFPIAVAKKHFGDDETGEKGDYEQYLNQPSYTVTTKTPDVCYGLDRASFNQGQNAKYDFSVENDLAQTLVSRGPGGDNDKIIGAICASDYRGIRSQDIDQGKYVIDNTDL